MAPLSLFAETDSGTILSQERQAKEQESVQNIETIPSETEVDKDYELKADSSNDTAEAGSDEPSQNNTSSEDKVDD